ncbi:MAG TPA: hypothetical protein VHL34_21010 [Rhizomicrobium sp.]|jgi:hypothetical protein|nr:hypothetical protein [Rhizomicrobium sp.]
MKRLGMLLTAATLGLFALTTEPATADGGYKACKVGDRVADKTGLQGTVVSVESDGIYCHVDLDNGDKNHYFIYWMLHAAGKPLVDPAQVARVIPGRYTCYAGNPIQYTFSDIIVKSASAYTDNKGNAGTFSYVPSTQMITFHSGTFKGSYAKYLENHAIGLASKPTTFFATVCDLKR